MVSAASFFSPTRGLLPASAPEISWVATQSSLSPHSPSQLKWGHALAEAYGGAQGGVSNSMWQVGVFHSHKLFLITLNTVGP